MQKNWMPRVLEVCWTRSCGPGPVDGDCMTQLISVPTSASSIPVGLIWTLLWLQSFLIRYTTLSDACTAKMHMRLCMQHVPCSHVQLGSKLESAAVNKA